MRKLLDIKPISQHALPWGAQVLGEGTSTIGQAGCVVASASMMLTYYGHPITPDVLNRNLIDTKLYFQEGERNLFVNANLTKLYPDVKWLGNHDYRNAPAPLADIRAAIDRGQPCFVWLINENTLHCTLAVGYDEGDILVNDPWTGVLQSVKAKWGDPAVVILYINYFDGPVPKPMETPVPVSSQPDLSKYPEFAKTYEKLVTNSDNYQRIINFVELKTSADTTDAKSVTEVIVKFIQEGVRMQTISLQKELSSQENLYELLMKEMQMKEETHSKEIRAMKNIVATIENLKNSYDEKLAEKQTELTELMKTKDRAVRMLAESREELEIIKHGVKMNIMQYIKNLLSQYLKY